MPTSNTLIDETPGLSNTSRSRPIQVIAVASGKGGVGKTSISVNLAVAMSAGGKGVMLLDGDLGLANVDVQLGLKPKVNLSHVINGSHKLHEIIIPGPAGVSIVPSSSGVARMANLSSIEHAGLIQAFSDLQNELDVLLIDVAAGVSDEVISFTRAAQVIIIVVCDEPTSISDAYALIKVLNRDCEMTRFYVVTNMVSSFQESQALYHKLTKVCEQKLDVTLHFMGSIPYDPLLRKSVQCQTPVLQAYPNSPSATAFRELANVAATWPMPRGSKGQLEFFVERLIGNGNNFGEEHS